MSRLDKLIEQIRDSEAFQQIKGKYDELDGQAKLYVNLGALAAIVLLVFLTIFVSMAKLNGMKSDINEREELIGNLQRSADTIRQFKTQQSASRGNVDVNAPLPQFVESEIGKSGLDPNKIEIGAERPGSEDKETREMLVDVKMTQTNLRQLNHFLFALTDDGTARGLNIKNLSIDTKGDPSGYLDADITIANYRPK